MPNKAAAAPSILSDLAFRGAGIIQDVKNLVKLVPEVHEARKAGADVQIKKIWSVPAIKIGYWSFTIEACLLCGSKWQPLIDVFLGFDEETQQALTFLPKDGEWANRARFWKRSLRPTLEPDLYHEAMLTFVQHYVKCVRRRREDENQKLEVIV